MDKNVSIVKVDQRHYRIIARENWGLSVEQMRGKHVHHRIPVSRGGTNDPTNLYVCSEWFHDKIWHSEDGGFTGLASRAGQLGAQAQPREVRVRIGNKCKTEKLGVFDPKNQDKVMKGRIKGAPRGGATGGLTSGRENREKKRGIFDPKVRSRSTEVYRENGSKTSAQVWMSTVDGFIGPPGPVANHNRAIGADPAARIRLE